jgi:Zn-dependent peptidase ImmA (M78 family)
LSLLHGYAHLLLHSEGLCDTYRATRATNPNGQLKARCNDLAATMLMPRAEVLARPQVEARRDTPTAWDYDALRDAAAPFGVAAEAFLRRLVTLGRTTQAFYDQRRQEFLTAYLEPGGRRPALVAAAQLRCSTRRVWLSAVRSSRPR